MIVPRKQEAVVTVDGSTSSYEANLLQLLGEFNERRSADGNVVIVHWSTTLATTRW